MQHNDYLLLSPVFKLVSCNRDNRETIERLKRDRKPGLGHKIGLFTGYCTGESSVKYGTFKPIERDTMNKIDIERNDILKELKLYFDDHYDNFGCYPMEFEFNKIVFNYDECVKLLDSIRYYWRGD